MPKNDDYVRSQQNFGNYQLRQALTLARSYFLCKRLSRDIILSHPAHCSTRIISNPRCRPGATLCLRHAGHKPDIGLGKTLRIDNANHSTVTDLARLRGKSTFKPSPTASQYAMS